MLDARCADPGFDRPSLLRPAALLPCSAEQFDKFLCGGGVRIGHAIPIKRLASQSRTLLNEWTVSLSRISFPKPNPTANEAMNRRLISLAAILVTIPVAAQQNAAPAGQAQTSIQVRVLQQTQINLGDHRLILNRVAPPIFPPVPPALSPAHAPTALDVARAKAIEARAPQKKNESLSLSATVYDNNITEVRSFTGGREYTIFSNIDFNLLAGLGCLETADTSYFLILGVRNIKREEVEAFNKRALLQGQKDGFKRIPQHETFSKMRSEYVIAKEDMDAQPPADFLSALDALHVFFDANKDRLANEHAKRVADLTKQEQWLKEHPPKPQDTVVNFWPGKNTVILDGQRKGVKR